MSEREGKKLVLTDSGIWVRVSGIFAVLGSLGFFWSKMPEPGKTAFTFAGWVFVICGLVMILFASDLTITAERSTRILRLEYRYWWLFNLTREIPFDDIADVRAVSSTTSDEGGTSTSYQLVVTLKDGKKVPFRWYSFTNSGKKQQAARLRAAMGLTHKRKASAADESFDETAETNY